jgi:hypothetical protein
MAVSSSSLATPSLPPIHSRFWTNLQWPDSSCWESLNILSLMNASSVVSEARYCLSGGTGSVTSLNVRFGRLVLLTYRTKCSVDFGFHIV